MYIPRIAIIWSQNRRTFKALAATILVIIIGWIAGLEGRLVAAIAALVALLTSAFTGFAALIGLIPWAGPIIVKALSIPAIWIMNAAGYFTAVFLAQRGHSKSVLDSRVMTYMLLVGIIIGYILGKII